MMQQPGQKDIPIIAGIIDQLPLSQKNYVNDVTTQILSVSPRLRRVIL
jgi:hypothetical protein